MEDNFDFDSGFPDGVFVVPAKGKNDPRINIYKICKYCEKHGKDLKTSTKEEMVQFYIYDTNNKNNKT